MNEKNSTYRVEIKNSGTPRNEAYSWQIYRNKDVLPILRSQQVFGSRMAGLADANRSRLQLVDTDLQNRKPERKLIYLTQRASRLIRIFCWGPCFPELEPVCFWAWRLQTTSYRSWPVILGLPKSRLQSISLAVLAINSGSILPVADWFVSIGSSGAGMAAQDTRLSIIGTRSCTESRGPKGENHPADVRPYKKRIAA